MRWFLNLAGGGLALTGVAKAFSAIGPARALDAADPLIGIPLRQLLLVVGLAELLIAFFCLFTDRRRFSLLAVAWISTNFLVYRLGLWLIGWHRPCGCLGTIELTLVNFLRKIFPECQVTVSPATLLRQA